MSRLLHPGLPAKFFEEYRLQHKGEEMTDEQILARLAEIEGWRPLPTHKWIQLWIDDHAGDYVDPLTSDADAFRLMVKHELAVEPMMTGTHQDNWLEWVVQWDIAPASRDKDLKRAICLAVIAANEGEEMSKLLHPGLPAKFFEEYRLQRLDIAKAKAVLDEAANRIEELERELESKRNPK